jgi:hypothetical protein
LAVTAVVLIVSEGVAPIGTATLPAAADPQTAGEAEDAQFVRVENVIPKIPVFVQSTSAVRVLKQVTCPTVILPITTGRGRNAAPL